MSTLSRLIFLKSKRNIKKPKLRLSVVYKNVIEPDFTKIYFDVLMFWIMTGKLAKIRKIGHSLRRGVRYYRFVLDLNLFDNFRFFKFVEFLLYSLFDYVGKKNYYCVDNNINSSFFLIKNINGFTNLRFSDNFYLSGMSNELIVSFVKSGVNYFDSSYFFVSMLKLLTK